MARKGEDARRVRPRRGDGPVPLSYAQQRLWLVDRMEPGTFAYNMATALHLRGRVEPRVLRRTLSEVVRRHEALRTVFAEGAEGPVQVVLPPHPFRLPVVELAGLPAGARETEVLRLKDEEVRRSFDLARGPLLRGTLVRLSEEESAVFFVMHHIVSDGWSMGILVNEISTLYSAFAEGRPSPFPELPVQYPDFAVWQRAWLSGDAMEGQLAYWRRRMADAPPVLDLPVDRPRPPSLSTVGDGLLYSLPPGISVELRELARREGVTVFMLLLAAFQVTLARWAGQEDVVVGTPTAGRTHTELEGLIGFFINTLVLRTDLSGDPTLRGLLARARETVLGAQANQDVPFERVVEELSPERSLQHTPLFQVLFAVQPGRDEELKLGAVEMASMGAEMQVAKFDLSFDLYDTSIGIWGTLSFRPALWERATMERLLEHYTAVLHALVADPDRRVSSAALASGEETRLLLEEWSVSGSAPAPARCVHELFAEQAARTPDAVALVSGGSQLTYAELDRRSDALAHVLAARGVGPDVRVGVLAERSPEMVAGLLGILKAGGAYVPLDPGYPAERLAYMLADSAVPVLLAQERLLDRLPEFGGEVVLLGGEESGEEGLPAPGVPVTPDHLAYVIYTSGSTGHPKGTEVPHRAIPGFFWDVEYARFDERTVLLQHSSTSWDALTLELWPALLRGGTCVLLPAQVSEPALLGEQIRGYGVTATWISSAYFNSIVDTTPEVLRGLEQVMIGGEAVSVPHVRRALEAYPELRIVNGYGPSECTVFTSCYPIPADFDAATIPIGRPVGDRRVYLL
ncbi:MAG TPA: condensation domain-containing protein, partial [Longimicrobiaceae bacterium]